MVGTNAIQIWQSPCGPLEIIASERGLQAVSFVREVSRPHVITEGSNFAREQAMRTQRQLEEYFARKRHTFDLDLDFAGTPFQTSVWKKLLKIPYGETRSYADLARSMGQPGASRAVGTANGRNPIAIIVPCHRVIASGGGLGGYSGGLENKRRLLDLENDQSSIFNSLRA